MTKVFDNAELLIKSIVAVKNEEECKTFLEEKTMTARAGPSFFFGFRVLLAQRESPSAPAKPETAAEAGSFPDRG